MPDVEAGCPGTHLDAGSTPAGLSVLLGRVGVTSATVLWCLGLGLTRLGSFR